MPFEVPEGWVWCKLKDCCYIVGRIGFRGYTKDDLVPEKQGAITLSPSNIVEDIMNYDKCTYISWAKYEESPEIKVIDGDILLVKTGSSFGKCALVSNLPQKATINPQFVVLKYIQIEKQYLTWVLQSGYARICYENFVLGTAIPTFTQAVLGDMLIPLPSITEQQRIIAEIKHWFALIDKIEQSQSDLQDTIKQTKSKILDLAIHGKLVPQDPNDEPASELLKRINPKAEITCDNGHSKKLPQSWIICRLGEICKVENGYAFSSDEYKPFGTPLVRISNIVNDKIDLSSCVFIQGDVEEKFIVSKGDLLIAMSGATTGKMGIYSQNEISYLNQRVGNIKILNKDLLLPEYRNYFMISKMDDILKLAYGGAQPNISAKIISNFLLPLPPISEQQRIVAKIEELFSILDDIQKSLEA